MTHSSHPLAGDYLARLRRAAAGLPRDRRRELLADIEAHLAEALPPTATAAEALTVLDRLGDPEDIVAAEAPARDPRGLREWAAIILLPLGGLIVGVGWIVGLICLWSSRAWTTREKWIGTLVLPGGFAAAALAALAVLVSAGGTCVSESQPIGAGASSFTGGAAVGCGGPSPAGTAAIVALGAVLLLAPFVTAIFLARRAREA